jgi:hypothetical protein
MVKWCHKSREPSRDPFAHGVSGIPREEVFDKRQLEQIMKVFMIENNGFNLYHEVFKEYWDLVVRANNQLSCHDVGRESLGNILP